MPKKFRGVPDEILERAVEELKGGTPLEIVCRDFQLPKTLLHKAYVKITTDIRKRLYGSGFIASQIFTKNEERDLEYSLFNYALTKQHVEKIAFEYAVKQEKRIPPNWLENEAASYDWTRAFMKRNPNVVTIKGDFRNLFKQRENVCKNIDDFYDQLETIISENDFAKNSVWNADEMIVTTITKSVQVNDKHFDKTYVVTGSFCVNAAGKTLPPFYVFPDGFYTANEKPEDVKFECTKSHSGRTTNETFLHFLEYFVDHVKASRSNKQLIILDNHETHISLDILEMAKENGIIFLTVPPSHPSYFQPLTLSIFGQFKKMVNSLLKNILPDSKVSLDLNEMPRLVSEALENVFTAKTIQKGFQAAGIFPLHRRKFDGEGDFVFKSEVKEGESKRDSIITRQRIYDMKSDFACDKNELQTELADLDKYHEYRKTTNYYYIQPKNPRKNYDQVEEYEDEEAEEDVDDLIDLDDALNDDDYIIIVGDPSESELAKILPFQLKSEPMEMDEDPEECENFEVSDDEDGVYSIQSTSQENQAAEEILEDFADDDSENGPPLVGIPFKEPVSSLQQLIDQVKSEDMYDEEDSAMLTEPQEQIFEE
jgi:hypothetical protein